MLLRFAVTNWLSFNGREEISLVATKQKGPETGIRHPESLKEVGVLPCALVYGANASGKTNLLNALHFLREVILSSHSRGNPSGGVPRKAFALSKQNNDRPTTIEIDFIADEVRYSYGFECDNDKFLNEWLYAFPEGKRRKLFERSGKEVSFGPYMRGPKKILADFMRENSLFISTATQNDHDELSKISNYFRSINVSLTTFGIDAIIADAREETHLDTRVIRFLDEIGTGITDYRIKKIKVPEEIKDLARRFADIADEITNGKGKLLKIGDIGDENARLELIHKGTEGEDVYFDLSQESSGTRRLLAILSNSFRALDNGSVYAIDELDISLHTHAVEHLISLFSDPKINVHGAQLISTVHDTNILNSKYLRRDQVWFCEKDRYGASHLFSLADIRSRPTDNFELGYLEGRYGAIPFGGDIAALFRKIEL